MFLANSPSILKGRRCQNRLRLIQTLKHENGDALWRLPIESYNFPIADEIFASASYESFLNARQVILPVCIEVRYISIRDDVRRRFGSHRGTGLRRRR